MSDEFFLAISNNSRGMVLNMRFPSVIKNWGIEIREVAERPSYMTRLAWITKKWISQSIRYKESEKKWAG